MRALAVSGESRSGHSGWRKPVLWTLYALLALAQAWWAGEWAAQREKRLQVDAIHRTLEVQVAQELLQTMEALH